MPFDLATPVALGVRKNPQRFVIARHVRDEAWIYFTCHEDEGRAAEYAGCLHFEGVWHLETTRFSGWKGYPNVRGAEALATYLLVEESRLLARLVEERTVRDPNWRRYDRRPYRHYVVESHDAWIDVIAADVEFSRVTGADARRLYTLWKQV